MTTPTIFIKNDRAFISKNDITEFTQILLDNITKFGEVDVMLRNSQTATLNYIPPDKLSEGMFVDGTNSWHHDGSNLKSRSLDVIGIIRPLYLQLYSEGEPQ
jgi:hypothetical protein